ncbi:alpha/beta fold hydrolase [Spirochaeta lutea]|uniref:AB hydrolase-1 domain-containing protein n=1 Tax=Spirochaeta lutea TaxID=1480694 RepID=A0A098QTE2_9SPIO|nr:alpha/beta hydrolase [Spirochaeta lutea]KGE70989.1 hypothetical protein DC28_13765 [Spirochaeta lutea]
MSIIRVNGLGFDVHVSGEKDNPGLVCIHGAGANLDQFEEQHAYFSDAFYVVSLSLRGHGNSEHPPGPIQETYAIRVLAQDVIQILETLNIRKTHLLGNSAGGVVGYEIVNQRPDLVRSLITFGTTGKMAVPGFLRQVTLRVDTRNVTHEPETRLKKLAAYTSKNPEVVSQVYRMFMAARAGIPGLRYALGSYNYLPLIRSMEVPYYILKGTQDRDINLFLGSTLGALKDQATRTNLDSRIITIPQAGHMTNLDNPREFNKRLLELVKPN